MGESIISVRITLQRVHIINLSPVHTRTHLNLTIKRVLSYAGKTPNTEHGLATQRVKSEAFISILCLHMANVFRQNFQLV